MSGGEKLALFSSDPAIFDHLLCSSIWEEGKQDLRATLVVSLCFGDLEKSLRRKKAVFEGENLQSLVFPSFGGGKKTASEKRETKSPLSLFTTVSAVLKEDAIYVPLRASLLSPYT